MANEEITTKLKVIIAEKLNVDQKEVTEDKLLVDLGADSLDAVELIMEVEDKFGIKIPDGEAESLTTVGSIQSYLESH